MAREATLQFSLKLRSLIGRKPHRHLHKGSAQLQRDREGSHRPGSPPDHSFPMLCLPARIFRPGMQGGALASPSSQRPHPGKRAFCAGIQQGDLPAFPGGGPGERRESLLPCPNPGSAALPASPPAGGSNVSRKFFTAISWGSTMRVKLSSRLVRPPALQSAPWPGPCPPDGPAARTAGPPAALLQRDRRQRSYFRPPFLLLQVDQSTLMSAGVTPEMREAWPTEMGRTPC